MRTVYADGLSEAMNRAAFFALLFIPLTVVRMLVVRR
jgi:hypothetical protein